MKSVCALLLFTISLIGRAESSSAPTEFYLRYSQLLNSWPKNDVSENQLSKLKNEIIAHRTEENFALNSPMYLQIKELQKIYQPILTELLSTTELSGCHGMEHLSLKPAKAQLLNDLSILVGLAQQVENEMTAARQLVTASLHANYLQLSCDLPLIHKIIAARNINSIYQILGNTKIFINMKSAQKMNLKKLSNSIKNINLPLVIEQSSQLEGLLLLQLNWGKQFIDRQPLVIYNIENTLLTSSPFSLFLNAGFKKQLPIDWPNTLKETDELYITIAKAKTSIERERAWTQAKIKFSKELIDSFDLKTFGFSQPTDFYEPKIIAKFYEKYKDKKSVQEQILSALMKTANPGGILHRAQLFSSSENNPTQRIEKLSEAWLQIVNRP